jgi:hypothetical protein
MLDHVRGVIVDHKDIIDQFYEMYTYDRSKSVLHHQAVAELFAPRRAVEAQFDRPVRILWAARFDMQNRIDVLAEIAEALNEAGIASDIHFYGEAVVAADPRTVDALQRLEAAGATNHILFASKPSSLEIDQFDLFLMTSEWK